MSYDPASEPGPLGWDVQVVIPSSQKSWIGKAFHIRDTIKGRYFYPREPDGQGEISNRSRPLKPGEVGEWILLDGTPATCANISLHNLFPGEVDLVISGPNYGRNTSAAFALSSGTLGAALSTALSKVRAIALSYGNFQYPTPPEFLDPANALSVRIFDSLWNDWGRDDDPAHSKAITIEDLEEDVHKTLALKQARGLREGEVDLYAVNIPMVPSLVKPEGLQIVWTRLWRNAYGRLFESQPTLRPKEHAPHPEIQTKAEDPSEVKSTAENEADDRLVFTFNPDFKDLIHPELSTLPIGTDAWAIHNDLVSVTPLRASFAEPGAGSMGLGSEWQENPLGGPWARGGRYWDS